MKELNLLIQKSVELLTELCAEQENLARVLSSVAWVELWM